MSSRADLFEILGTTTMTSARFDELVDFVDARDLALRQCYAAAADALVWAREFGSDMGPPPSVHPNEAVRAVKALADRVDELQWRKSRKVDPHRNGNA